MISLTPVEAEILSRKEEAAGIHTFRLKILDKKARESYRFQPGQFNMIYLFGMGEIPISIVSDPDDPGVLDHTVRSVGRVSEKLCAMKKGERMGLRGPFGTTWPLDQAEGKDLVLITGGLGCAPVVSVIQYIMNRREKYGSLKILHGIKAPADLLYKERISRWRKIPDTEVYLTVDRPDRRWKEHVGLVTRLFDKVRLDPGNGIVMICGPEVMMRFAVKALRRIGFKEEAIYLSLERNMKCAVGFCGHCQLGPVFICRQGPVFSYDKIRHWFSIKGA
jgi:sulfhydrogenase subunit gamma (sulfur reductase)